MSSHHIVREKQEPALLIAGLDNFDDESLGQLLEWSPTVVVTANTAERVEAYGIKIDWLVADEMTGLQQSDIKLLPVGDADPVITALDYLVTSGYPAVNLVADSFEPGIFFRYADKLDLIVFFEKKKIVAVHSGFSKWKPAGERIEFLTLPNHFVYTGLSPVGDNVYETTADGFFSLQFSDGFVCMVEWV